MKSNKLNLFIILFYSVCNIGCSQTDGLPDSKVYEPCCGVDKPLSTIQNGFTASIPNVFTPNNDNKNDVFHPLLSDKSLAIIGFFITDMNDSIIYFTPQLDYEALTTSAWDGKKHRNEFNFNVKEGEEYKGQFKYKYTVFFPANESEPAATIDVEGTACVIRCGEEASVFNEKTGCFFTNQFSDANFENSKKAEEDGCFK